MLDRSLKENPHEFHILVNMMMAWPITRLVFVLV
jgi:hypothetical protein